MPGYNRQALEKQILKQLYTLQTHMLNQPTARFYLSRRRINKKKVSSI
jgi:hypothetical protein